MMRTAHIWVGSEEAGVLEEQEAGGFRFTYHDNYQGPRAFLGMPLKQRRFEWKGFPPEFDGLIPEGVLLEQLLRTHKLERSDRMGLLLAIGSDTVGWVSICAPEDIKLHKPRTIATGSVRKSVIRPEHALENTNAEIVRFHGQHRLKMSISGVQAKAQAVFERSSSRFKLVDKGGGFILKPQVEAYANLPENECLSMTLAAKAGIATPDFGLTQSQDGKLVYYIQRFDRAGPKNSKVLRVEDMAQVMGAPAEWKYLGNIESLVNKLSQVVSNPVIQKAEFLKRFLFNWIIGNGDMHLKNWSLMELKGVIQLTPAYDFLNTYILIKDDESALDLDDRKNHFDRNLLLDYLAKEICGVRDAVLRQILDSFKQVPWTTMIMDSQLPDPLKKDYESLVNKRLSRLLD